jgi:hypothetical protein
MEADMEDRLTWRDKIAVAMVHVVMQGIPALLTVVVLLLIVRAILS